MCPIKYYNNFDRIVTKKTKKVFGSLRLNIRESSVLELLEALEHQLTQTFVFKIQPHTVF